MSKAYAIDISGTCSGTRTHVSARAHLSATFVTFGAQSALGGPA